MKKFLLKYLGQVNLYFLPLIWGAVIVAGMAYKWYVEGRPSLPN